MMGQDSGSGVPAAGNCTGMDATAAATCCSIGRSPHGAKDGRLPGMLSRLCSPHGAKDGCLLNVLSRLGRARHNAL